MSSNAEFNTIVIGAGQAGLAAGYYLRNKGDDFVILDENAAIGAAWRDRWDSLRLFTPTYNNHLPGMKFPKPDLYFPTKDETADYLDAYARQFDLPVHFGIKVNSLERNEAGYHIDAGQNHFHARHVIIATGAFRTPNTPSIARELSKDIFQMHSSEYKKPSDMPADNALVVGAGNSGAEIALDLARSGKKVWLAGRDVGRIPADKLGLFFGGKPYWWFMRNMMTINTPMGRKMKTAVLSHGSPLIRARREEVAQAGVELLPRLIESQDDIPCVEDGQVIAAEGIIWATGFHPDYRWIKLPIFDEAGRPVHERGVVPQAPGVYFLGLLFQTGITSSLLGGVGADARYITDKIMR
ncbi:MAG TPA: NAD(P)-binding domain-containing protein [Anaerolineales bacterium]|nr:NAD(P)-binding domain-containing protein [Anaerolineales bacterium]